MALVMRHRNHVGLLWLVLVLPATSILLHQCRIDIQTMSWLDTLLVTLGIDVKFAEVQSCEGCNHTNDVWVLQVLHDLNLLKITLGVDLVCELFLLQRYGFDCINLAIAPASNLAHDSKSATSQQFYDLKVISGQTRTVLNGREAVL